MGCPGTGRPGAGRIPAEGALDCPMGTPGRGGGALYTGRGPVCGTIMRGAGVGDGAGAAGVAGRGGAAGAEDAVTTGAGGAGGATTAGGGGGVGRGVAGIGGVAEGAAVAGFSGGATTAGRGGGAVGAGAGGATVGFGGAGGTTAGRGGATGFGTGATASFCCVMAFRTSPGREIWDKSILVLISSSPRSGRAVLDDCAGPASPEPLKCARTFSASCSSRELE